MKHATLFLLALTLASPALAAEPDCVGLEIHAQYQLVPVDGTICVLGQIPTEQTFGFATNPIVADSVNDTVHFNVYETVDITKMGRYLGTVAKAKGFTVRRANGALGCDLEIEGKELGGKHRMAFIATTGRGDIVLRNHDTQSALPLLLIKKIASKLR